MQSKNEEFPHIDFIGVGVDKAATTWIYQCLREHPEICMSKPKETGFFGNNYGLGKKWFKERFAHCGSEKIRGEYTPAYLTHPDTAERIKKHVPHAKLIICFRNPVELFESGYNFAISHGKSPDKDINEFVEKALAEKESSERPHIERRLYTERLREYLNHFTREQILILIYEDIEKDPVLFAQHIYQFLGADSSFTPSVAMKRVNVTVANRVYFRFLSRTLLSLRAHIKNAPFGRKIANFFKLIGVNALVKFLLRKNMIQKKKAGAPTRKYKLNEEMRAHLHAFYKKDTEELSKILNRDLTSIWQS